jgi:hypothetical protein
MVANRPVVEAIAMLVDCVKADEVAPAAGGRPELFEDPVLVGLANSWVATRLWHGRWALATGQAWMRELIA